MDEAQLFKLFLEFRKAIPERKLVLLKSTHQVFIQTAVVDLVRDWAERLRVGGLHEDAAAFSQSAEFLSECGRIGIDAAFAAEVDWERRIRHLFSKFVESDAT